MGSHRRLAARTPVLGGPAARVTVLSAAFATAAVATAPAGAAPEDDPARVRAEVARLYEQAERAGELYNGAAAKERALRGRLGRAQDRLARGQDRVNELREQLAPLAGAQYRSAGLDPALRLLLTAAPDDWLNEATTLDRIGAAGERRLRTLRHRLRGLDQERAEAGRILAELERSRTTLARHKRTLTARLTRVRSLLATLPGGPSALDPARADRAELPPPDGRGAASPWAATALAAARTALGRPYAYGATGPASFDCSGLVQWAYAHAGVALPRTSQAQSQAGRRIPLSEARPGDLVTYRGDASHIGLYAGSGQVLHAPYPGAPVRHDPVRVMPVHSVTRV